MSSVATAMLAELREHDPEAWADRVRAALAEYSAPGLAAASLGVSRSTLWRWLQDAPEIADGLTLAGPGNPTFRVTSPEPTPSAPPPPPPRPTGKKRSRARRPSR